MAARKHDNKTTQTFRKWRDDDDPNVLPKFGCTPVVSATRRTVMLHIPCTASLVCLKFLMAALRTSEMRIPSDFACRNGNPKRVCPKNSLQKMLEPQLPEVSAKTYLALPASKEARWL